MAHKVTNSAVNKGSHQARLDHWVGPHQHVGTGISTDPTRESVPAGVLKSKQHKED